MSSRLVPALYRAAGFVGVDPERTAEWNQGQPTAYVWSEWVSGTERLCHAVRELSFPGIQHRN